LPIIDAMEKSIMAIKADLFTIEAAQTVAKLKSSRHRLIKFKKGFGSYLAVIKMLKQARPLPNVDNGNELP